MPKWRDLRRFLDKHGHYKRSGEIGRSTWRCILKQQLGITQEEFNAGL